MTSLDLHVDYPWQCFKASSALDLAKGSSLLQTDFPRMDKGGVATIVAALYLSDHQQDTLGPEKSWNAILNQARTSLGFGDRVLIALEGGRLIGEDPNKLERLALLGIKYLTLTHNKNTNWADSATDSLANNGLTAVGKRLVKAIEANKVFVDISHASDQTALDVFAQATRPVLATHSGVRNLIDHPRNLSDTLIRMIADSGGLIGVPYATRFVGTSDGVVAAIDHIAQLTGSVSHIGIGSDLDGANTICKDVSEWSNVLAPLSDLGYSDEQITAIKGGNARRLFNG